MTVCASQRLRDGVRIAAAKSAGRADPPRSGRCWGSWHGVTSSGWPAGYGSAVPAGATRPLVFLDVDGVLIPWRSRPSRARGRSTGRVADGSGNPLLERLDPVDGRGLLALPGDLVWASSWMVDANEVVAPRLGLPTLPVVDWPDDEDGLQAGLGLRWKTVALSRWAGGRPFVWLDDEITGADQRWVAVHHPQPALLHRIDSQSGLTEADLAAVGNWLHQHNQAG
jgi:HAD domain in Swiss Army Knife RNA repair proteins